MLVKFNFLSSALFCPLSSIWSFAPCQHYTDLYIQYFVSKVCFSLCDETAWDWYSIAMQSGYPVFKVKEHSVNISVGTYEWEVLLLYLLFSFGEFYYLFNAKVGRKSWWTAEPCFQFGWQVFGREFDADFPGVWDLWLNVFMVWRNVNVLCIFTWWGPSRSHHYFDNFSS